jgi:hypothetical protein
MKTLQMRSLVVLLLAAQWFAKGAVQHYQQDEVVVGTLGTTPARISLLNETLWSLVTQTRKLDAVIVVYEQTIWLGEECPPPPKWLTEYGHGVTVLRPEEGWGPAGKLIPALAIAGSNTAPAGGRKDSCVDCGAWLSADPFASGGVQASGGPVLGPDSHVITFDDDRVYEPWLVSLLLDASRSHPDAAVGTTFDMVSSRAYTGEPRWCGTKLKSSIQQQGHGDFEPTDPAALVKLGSVRTINADILLGCGGVLYKPRFFDLSHVSNRTALLACRTTDDVWFSSQLEWHGVRRMALVPSIRRKEIYGDWSNRRGRADNVKPLLDGNNRTSRYTANCECALSLHHSNGVWLEVNAAKKSEL